MFGYVTPDRPYLFIKDETLYKALYCGLCKSIGSGCGQRARSALTYDMAFMSALIHNIKHEDVTVKKSRCVLHIFRRRPIAEVDDTTVMLGCINTALAYYKLCDDKADGDKKGIFRHYFKKGFKRAKRRHPEAVEIIQRQLEKQSALERSGCAVIDEACEPTAQMMKKLSSYALGGYSTEDTEWLFYDLGKWVYLADALDDYDKDVKKGRYNVLYNAFKKKCKADALKENAEEITYVLDSLFADMRIRLANINFRYNHDLTDNIILRGIPLKTRSLLSGGCGKKGCKKNEQTKS
ncbi:MAG: hypothetical protein K2J83_01095 [Clostridia bacterium]|nr:hypothetical protein [Clostridia bacterium]